MSYSFSRFSLVGICFLAFNILLLTFNIASAAPSTPLLSYPPNSWNVLTAPGNVNFQWSYSGSDINNIWYYFVLIKWDGTKWITINSEYTQKNLSITKSLTDSNAFYAWQVAAVDISKVNPSANDWYAWATDWNRLHIGNPSTPTPAPSQTTNPTPPAGGTGTPVPTPTPTPVAGPYSYYVDGANVMGHGCSDTNTGDATHPFCTIKKATQIATAGKKILIKAGIYRERITFTNSGSSGNPIIYDGDTDAQGNPLVIIDGSAQITTGTWSIYSGGGTPTAIYQAAFSSLPYALFVNVSGTWRSINKVASCTNPTCPTFTFNYNHSLAVDSNATVTAFNYSQAYPGISVNYWDGIDAEFGNYNNSTYLRFRNGDNPNNKTMAWAPSGAVVSLVNKNYITIRHWRIINGANGVSLNGSSNNIIEDSTIEAAHIAFEWAGASANNHISHNKILNIPYSTYGRGTWSLMSNYPPGISGSPYTSAAYYTAGVHSHIYYAEKYRWGVSYDSINQGMRACSGCLSSGAINNHIDYNTFDGQMEGIYLFQDNLEIDHNTIKNGEGTAIVIEWGFNSNNWQKIHDNTITNHNNCFRFANLENGTQLHNYVWNNTCWNPLGQGTGIGMTYSCWTPGTNCPLTGPTFNNWIYHNSIAGGYKGLEVQDGQGSYTWPNSFKGFHFINNIFSVPLYGWSTDFGDDTTITDFNYNYISWNTPGALLRCTAWLKDGIVTSYCPASQHNIIYQNHPCWNYSSTVTNFTLPISGNCSDARNHGIDISRNFTLPSGTYAPLYGFSPGYFSGSAPNIGAVQ